MHTFTPRWTDTVADDHDEDIHHVGPFRSADELIASAELDRLSTWRTWPELWHLDDSGMFRCMSRRSTGVTVRQMADRPGRLLECRRLVSDGCPDNWVVIEHRMAWQRQGMDVTEVDGAAFVRLRQALGAEGVNLLDVVVINDDMRWWSLHELTAGTTTWTFVADRSDCVVRHPATRRPA